MLGLWFNHLCKFIYLYSKHNFIYLYSKHVSLFNMIASCHILIILYHYQKFAKYQRIYRRNIYVGNLRSKLPTDTFPSVIQSITTDGPFFVRNSVGNYRRKISVCSYRLNFGRKSFRIKKKRRAADVEVLTGYFFPTDSKRGIWNCRYSDVIGSPFKLPTDSPRDLKWQIRTVTCSMFPSESPT
jgi:hypothetical protein